MAQYTWLDISELKMPKLIDLCAKYILAYQKAHQCFPDLLMMQSHSIISYRAENPNGTEMDINVSHLPVFNGEVLFPISVSSMYHDD